MKVLINRTDALGDTLLSLPMAQAIKSHHPKAQVYFLVRALSQDLMEGQPFIDDYWSLPLERGPMAQLNWLRKIFRREGITHYLYAGGSHLPSVAAKLAGVGERLGLLSRWPSFLTLNRGVRQRRSRELKHETQWNVELLAPLGIAWGSWAAGLVSKLYMGEGEHSERWRRLLDWWAREDRPLEGPFIVVHPGMTGHTLNWPMKSYVRCLLELQRRWQGCLKVVVSYTPADGAYLEEFQKWSEREGLARPWFFNGAQQGLRNYMACLKQAQLFLGPSTGPLHMARALDCPLVGLYSPLRAQCQERWGPWPPGREDAVLVAPPAESVNQSGDCMEQIEVALVAQQMMKLLERGRNANDFN